MASKPVALLLFLGDAASDRRSENFRRAFEAVGFAVELVAPKTRATRGPLRFYQHHRALLAATADRHAEVVMACDLYSLAAARRMKRERRAAHVIYDAREVYTALPHVQRRPLSRLVWHRLEHRGLRAADTMIVTAPHDAEAILERHGFVPRTALVRNLPWRDESLQPDPKRRRAMGLGIGRPVLVYVGGLQTGRGLKPLIEALHDADTDLLLIGDGALRTELEQTAQACGLTDRVRFTGALPSDEALRLAASCDAGVVLVEPVSESYALALPSKLFEYMMAGIPVLTNRMRHVEELFGEQPWMITIDTVTPQTLQRGLEALVHLLAAKRAGAADVAQALTTERSLALGAYHFEADAAALLTRLAETWTSR